MAARDEPATTATREAAGHCDAVVVLGAAFRPDDTVSPALVRRARHAAALVRAGRAPRLIASGGPCGGSGARSEAEAIAAIAEEEGVPGAAIVLEPTARSTRENACRCAALMHGRGWCRALIVTDGYHMPRALMAFAACGLTVSGSAVPGTAGGPMVRLREAAARGWYRLRLGRGLMWRNSATGGWLP